MHITEGVLETTPPRRSLSTSSEEENKSTSDVFKWTNFTETFVKEALQSTSSQSQTLESRIPRLNSSTPGGPGTSTPRTKLTQTTLPRREPQRQFRNLSNPDELATSGTHDLPAETTNKKTIRELKNLQSFNKEPTIEELPPRRQRNK